MKLGRYAVSLRRYVHVPAMFMLSLIAIEAMQSIHYMPQPL